MAGIERSNVYVREAAKEERPPKLWIHPGRGAMSTSRSTGRWQLLANKLPARPEPPASQRRRENGLVDAGESNSGRMFREEPRWYEH